MAILTVESSAAFGQSGVDNTGGIEPTFVAADVAGDEFANNGKTYIEINNASATPITATIVSQQASNQGFTHNVVVTVPNAESRRVGGFLPARFNNASQRVEVTYSAVTSVTVAVVSV